MNNARGGDANARVRYEPDETPPVSLSIGLGAQLAMLTVAGVVLTPVIVIRAAGGASDFMSWAVFAAVIVSGATTILQAVRLGRIGAGYVLLMGTSGAFISVCITAIAEGGPAMLATLVVISSLFQFALASRLSLFRRIFTPTVAGTVIMLIPVAVMPIIFKMLGDVPEGTPAAAAPGRASTSNSARSSGRCCRPSSSSPWSARWKRSAIPSASSMSPGASRGRRTFAPYRVR